MYNEKRKIKITKWIVPIILIIVMGFSITSILNRLVYNMGNYTLFIRVKTDFVADYSTITKEYKTSNGSSVQWFNRLEESQKLVDYMKANNLKIMPGVYEFKRYASFEEIEKILKFEKIE